MKHESLYLAQKPGIGSGNISTYISHLKEMPSQSCIIKELDPQLVSDKVCVCCSIPSRVVIQKIFI